MLPPEELLTAPPISSSRLVCLRDPVSSVGLAAVDDLPTVSVAGRGDIVLDRDEKAERGMSSTMVSVAIVASDAGVLTRRCGV
jgi:hypothetical protein